MAKNLFLQMEGKTLLKLNMASIIVTAFCEIFVVYSFITKGFQEDVEKWKFNTLLIGLVIVTLLLLASIASFIYFLNFNKKKVK